MSNARLLQQIQFLKEADKIKSVFRRNHILHGERLENDAEHSWQLALMAIVLSEYAAPQVDVLRVVKMLLIHDLVEIDAGDTFAFDQVAVLTQREREERAAGRVFGLLPASMAGEMRAAWEEFEASETPEARFAKSLDCLGGGVIPNCHHQGGCWREAGVSVERVKELNSAIGIGSPALWEYAESLIDQVQQNGFLDNSNGDTRRGMSTSTVATDERVREVEVTEDTLTVALMDGRCISVPLVWYPRLLQANDAQRHNWQVVGGGYDIHWPDVDEDLSVEGLLRGAPAPRSKAANNK